MQFSGQLSDVDIRLLRIFVMVAECGGVAAAAHELNVDRSTVSRQLTDLETRLGLRVCERSRAGFWLTDEGQVIFDRTQELLGALSDFRRHVNDIHRELAGELTIAVADTCMWDQHFRLPEAIAALRREAPQVQPVVRVLSIAEANRAVLSGASQIGILPVYARRSGLHYDVLGMERNALYCGKAHPLAASQKTPSLAELRQHEVIALGHESGGAAQIQRRKLLRGPMTNSDEATSILILSGLYVGYLADYYGDQFVQAGRMVPIETPRTAYHVDLCAVVSDREQHSGVTRLFLDLLRQTWR